MQSPYIQRHLIRQILQYGGQKYHQIVRQRIQPQQRFDINTLQQKISILKHTAAHNGWISLSANQVKLRNRIFVILKKDYMKYGKWNGYEDLFLKKKPSECYDAIINPDLLSYSNFKIKGDQQCPSVQGLKFKVWIPITNRMTFTKYLEPFENGKTSPSLMNCSQYFTGFYSRVFDHQYRHLQGLLVNIPEISNNQMYLNSDSKMNPQNYNFIKQHRMEAQFFNSQNFAQHIKREIQQQKELLNKQYQTKTNKGLTLENIKQTIDPNLKQKLTKSYQSVMQTLQKQNQSPQIIGKIKQSLTSLTLNDKKQQLSSKDKKKQNSPRKQSKSSKSNNNKKKSK